MLYISSRNKTDSFTSYRTLCDDNAPDGGLYLPYQLPRIDGEALQKMCACSFGENVAQILNLFFSAKLTAWDVECCIGRMPVRITPMNHRILSAECFHNPQNSYSYLVDSLYRLLSKARPNKATVWARIAIRIAVMFGLYTLMPEEVRENFDVALTTGDFSGPMAAWYARKMGLPIQKIVCCCNENGAAWDLIQRGEFNTGMPLVDTGMQELDQPCPEQIERLVYHTLGFDMTQEYNVVCNKKGVFHLEGEAFAQLSSGFAAAVVGRDRILSTVRSVYRSNGYFISPVTAIAYGGLQDFRAKSGESRHTLILADYAPVLYADQVIQACGTTKTEFMKALTSVKE